LVTPASSVGPTPSGATPAPTHGCARCGAPIPLEAGLCESCNPLGLKDVASSQAHGTVLLAIVIGVAVLALLGKLAIAGIGPFSGEVTGVVSSPPGLTVTIQVTNEGTAAGQTTCRLYDPSAGGIGPESTYVQSPRVEAGATTTFEASMTTLGSTVRPVAVDCGS
jgi:hypothetical protein